MRKSGSLRRGFVLIEAMLALSLLTVVGLILLKLSINILAPRQWVLQQTITDAYMTGERATAERAPFSAITGAASPWPLGATAVTPNVFLGRLPGGANITGTLTRTRSLIRDSFNNEVYPIANDADTTPAGVAAAALAKTRNPSQMQVCKLQSILTYTVGRNSYVKSRSVARSQ